MQFARHFVDAPERVARKKTRDIRAMMNLHNNLAGRLVSTTFFEYENNVNRNIYFCFLATVCYA